MEKLTFKLVKKAETEHQVVITLTNDDPMPIRNVNEIQITIQKKYGPDREQSAVLEPWFGEIGSEFELVPKRSL